MNTPTHLVVNLLVLGRRDRPREITPIGLGALVPDAPMLVFYLWERLVAGASEQEIWGARYWDPGWQAFIDAFNSLPLIALGLGVSWYLYARTTHTTAGRWLGLFFTSMALHVALDLPLHHEDAHRHLFPFSDWRFLSPVSYWDPERFGGVVSLLEVLIGAFGLTGLWIRYRHPYPRTVVAVTGAIYVAFAAFVVLVWM